MTDANHNVTTTIRVDDDNYIGFDGVARNVYSAYGEVERLGDDWTGTGAEALFDGPMYAGYFFDTDTSLYQVRNRYYDANLSTWLNRDPIGYNSGDTNLYRYVGNNPANLNDPSGLASLTEVTEGTLFYTWHMGWLDKSHMGKNKGLVSAWEKIRKAKPGEKVTFELKMAQANKTTTCSFGLRVAKTENARKGQLLAAWQYLAENFEAYQNTGIQASKGINKVYGMWIGQRDKQPSGFSLEDLVSDLVGFYAVVEDADPMDLVNKYAGRYDAKDEKIVSTAIWVFNLKCEPGYKKWVPKYFDYKKLLTEDFSLENWDKRDDSISIELHWVATDTQKVLPTYAKKYGQPKFPEFFQQYTPNKDGYIYMRCKND